MSKCDIAIVGGGMVGVSLAMMLAERLSSSAEIVLLESFPLPSSEAKFANAYTPSFDARSTALSYSSYHLYECLGIWAGLAERACPIRQIHVSERARFGNTLLRATDYEWEALGFVIENAWLGASLIQALHRQGRVSIRSPIKVDSARGTVRGYQLTLADGEQLDARLMIVADGAESDLRSALGIEAEKTSYEQYALIANIGHRLEHKGCAYERFTDQGPLAMLPLLEDSPQKFKSALVWTLPESEALARLDCDEHEFLKALQDRFGYRLGRLDKVGERFAYPLCLVRAKEQVRTAMVVLGNAAHALHPVAGQGFNLALRDAAVLTRVLGNVDQAGKDFAQLAVLQQYLDLQQTDQERTVVFSHYLPSLFSSKDPAFSGLRDLGLFALDLNARLKREFVQHTAGMSALAATAGKHE